MGCPMITIKKCFYLLLINQIFTAFTYRRLCSPSPCLNGLIFSVLHIINDTPTITNKVSQGQTPLVLEALLLLYGLPLVLTLRKFVELEALAELQNITVL